MAGWGSRIGALVIDWGLCMIVAITAFGTGVMTGGGWRAWMILAVFFVQTTVHDLAGRRQCRSTGQPAGRGPPRPGAAQPGLAILRAALVCLVIPALVIGPDRRGLHDLAAGTVVVRRR